MYMYTYMYAVNSNTCAHSLLCATCPGADVNRHTANNDHTVLSLASTGGHISVVQYLLMQGADPMHVLRVRSTLLLYVFIYMCVYSPHTCTCTYRYKGRTIINLALAGARLQYS